MNGEDWWSISGAYNNAVFPMQIISMVTGIVLTYFLFAKPNTTTNSLMKAYLAFTFAWNGIVFFLVFGKELPGTFLGAPLFIITAVLFVIDIFTKKTRFQLPDARWHSYLTVFWILCAFLYPLIGLPLGHYYPRTCMFGVFPCPTTVFALALLAAATPKVDKKVYILLLIWALPSVGKCFGALDLQEDCVLFVAGVYGLVMLVKNWKATFATPAGTSRNNGLATEAHCSEGSQAETIPYGSPCNACMQFDEVNGDKVLRVLPV